MRAVEKLRAIINENKQLKEELSMVKENETTKDTQVSPSQPAPKSAGEPAMPSPATSDVKKENDATQDTQTSPAGNIATGGASHTTGATIDSKSESSEEDEDTKKEIEGDSEPSDMDKVAEILERLSSRLERIESSMGTKTEQEVPEETPAQPMQPVPSEEPKPPVQEKLDYKMAFKESMSNDDFGNIVNSILK